MDGSIRPGDPLVWTVKVTDPFNRERTLRTGARDGHVVLQPPPGEGCTLTPDEADFFAASITAASALARSQRPRR